MAWAHCMGMASALGEDYWSIERWATQIHQGDEGPCREAQAERREGPWQQQVGEPIRFLMGVHKFRCRIAHSNHTISIGRTMSNTCSNIGLSMESPGWQALEAMQKHLKVAQSRSAKGEALSALQQEAMRFLVDKDCIKEEELPQEYHDAVHKINMTGAGVCSRCRNSSGCLSCDAFKCTRYWMRKEHKRTGKTIDAKYQWGAMRQSSCVQEKRAAWAVLHQYSMSTWRVCMGTGCAWAVN